MAKSLHKLRRLGRWLGAWWLRPLYKSAVFIGTILLAVYLVGVAQRRGWIQSGTAGTGGDSVTMAQPATEYICPMMCTPPSSEPGRCPVCAMELVPATAGGEDSGERSVSIATADRRLVGIKTASATRSLAERKIRGVGKIVPDETRLARIPAETGGRVERLFVNFTGQRIDQGAALVSLYSPDLYAAQTELLTLKQTRRRSNGRSALANVRDALIDGARERLFELGMTREQIAELESRAKAETRVTISSPQAGTVTQLMLKEGQYVKPGETLIEIADLSHVWLVTELFAEEAALVRYGQRVEATINSLPGQPIAGRVCFIDPMVDPKTKAVLVRVTLSNEAGGLRPGDEATVSISVPASPTAGLFDPQLAGRWICPIHPEHVADQPGICPRSQQALVATSTLGFISEPAHLEQPIVIPRSALLMAGDDAVAYVEVDEGEFELRVVKPGARLGSDIVIYQGLEEGDVVATNGNFLIDSQMQLSSKPSLIDPAKAEKPEVEYEFDLPDFDDDSMMPMPVEEGEPAGSAQQIETDEEWHLPPLGIAEELP